MREDRPTHDSPLFKPLFIVFILAAIFITMSAMKSPGVIFVGTENDINHIKNSQLVMSGSINQVLYLSQEPTKAQLSSFINKISNLTILLLIPESSFREARGDKIDKAIAKLRIIKGYHLFSQNIGIVVTESSGQIIYLDCLRRYLNYTVDVQLQDQSKIRRTNRLLVSSIVQRGAIMTEMGCNHIYRDAMKEVQEFMQIQQESLIIIDKWKGEIVKLIEKRSDERELASIYNSAKYRKSKNLFQILAKEEQNKARLVFWKISQNLEQQEQFYGSVIKKCLKIGLMERCNKCVQPRKTQSESMLVTKCKDQLREEMNICTHDNSYEEADCMLEEYKEALLSLSWNDEMKEAKEKSKINQKKEM